MMTPWLLCGASLLAFTQVVLNVMHFLHWLQLAFCIIIISFHVLLYPYVTYGWSQPVNSRRRLIHSVTFIHSFSDAYCWLQ